jgi:ProP effector
MPERTQDSNSKPVVVIRRRPVAKAAVASPAAKPAVVKSTSVATAKPITAKPVVAKQAPAQPVTAKPVSPPVASPLAAPPKKPAPKPPTPPEDPAVIAARRAARTEAIRGVLREIMARWPHTFPPYPEPVRPLARGIVHLLAAQLPTVSKTRVHQAIGFWQRQRKALYLHTVIAGGPRYDLDGNPQGEVTPEEQERARRELVAWRADRREKRRTAPQQDRPVTARDRRDTGNPQPSLPVQSDALPEAESKEPVSEGIHK